MVFIILWILLLLTPFQTALHFWPPFAYTFGFRHDYLSPTLFLTDIPLLALFIYQVANHSLPFPPRLRPYLPLIVYIFLNIFFSSLPLFSLLTWFRWFLLLNFAFTLASFTTAKLKLLFLPLLFSSAIVSILALVQFILQKSLGSIFYYLGERTFTHLTPGIAKFDVSSLPFSLLSHNPSLLRPYSTFSHPNSLAGFLLVLLCLTLFDLKKNRPRLLKYLFLIFAFPALLLTASKTAFLGLLLLFLVLYLNPRRILNHFSQIVAFILPFSLIPLLNLSPTIQWLSQRRLLLLSAFKLILRHPFLGVGLGTETYAQASFNLKLFLPGQLLLTLQPVHHSLLLLLSEIGFLGFLLCLYYLRKLPPPKLSLPLTLSLFLVFLTSLTDHYWLTLPQNRLLLAFVFGLFLRASKHPTDVQFPL